MFRQIKVYQAHEPLEWTAEGLTEALEPYRFVECPPMSAKSVGFVPPSGLGNGPLVHECAGHLFLALQIEEKMLPPAAIKEEARKRVLKIEAEQDRIVGRAEERKIREQVYAEHLPTALARTKRYQVMYSRTEERLYIDCVSAAKSSEVMSEIRKALGTLPIAPISTQQIPGAVMTGWLINPAAARALGVVIGESADMSGIGDSLAKASFRAEDLLQDNVVKHLTPAGGDMELCALEVSLAEDRINFTLTEELDLKGIEWNGLFDHVDGEDRMQQFDTSCELFGRLADVLIRQVLSWFGGPSDPKPLAPMEQKAA